MNAPTQQEAAAAAARLLNAQRTGCPHAVAQARAFNQFEASRAQAAAATQRIAEREHAIGPAGRYYESLSGYGPTL